MYEIAEMPNESLGDKDDSTAHRAVRSELDDVIEAYEDIVSNEGYSEVEADVEGVESSNEFLDPKEGGENRTEGDESGSEQGEAPSEEEAVTGRFLIDSWAYSKLGIFIFDKTPHPTWRSEAKEWMLATVVAVSLVAKIILITMAFIYFSR